jgi:hypothetical protein
MFVTAHVENADVGPAPTAAEGFKSTATRISLFSVWISPRRWCSRRLVLDARRKRIDVGRDAVQLSTVGWKLKSGRQCRPGQRPQRFEEIADR